MLFSKKIFSLIICLFLLIGVATTVKAADLPLCPDNVQEVSCAPGDTVLKCVVDPTATTPVYKNYKCLLGSEVVRDTGLGNETTDVRNNIRTAIMYGLGFLGVLAVIMVIYGGLVWLTSQGSSDKIKKGRDILIWAAIGAIVISIAWTITAYILKVGEMVS